MNISVTGQGPDLVLIHGWSMHSGIWHEFGEQLAKSYTLHLVDLPGHGDSEWHEGDFTAEHIIEQLAEKLPTCAYYLGWSLGGLIAALFSYHHPECVRKLVMLAASPCFAQKANWLCAMPQTTFMAFADKLETQQAETLQRFLMLQAKGAEQSKQTIRCLSEQMAEKVAHHGALSAGLDMLINSDIREQMAALTMPVKLILGECDTLIPSGMVTASKLLNSQMETALISGAGHAPFVSHPQHCLDEVARFLNEECADG